MAKTRQEIEHQFRRGTNTFFWIGALSALGTSALYHGFTYQPVGALCLATPMVLDVVVRAIDPRLFGQQIHYYCYMFSLILAAVFVLLGLFGVFIDVVRLRYAIMTPPLSLEEVAPRSTPLPAGGGSPPAGLAS